MKIAQNFKKNPRLILSLLFVITILIDFIIYISHYYNEYTSYILFDFFTIIIDVVLFSFLFKGYSSSCIIFIINKLFGCYLLITNKIPLVVNDNPDDKFLIYFILSFIVLILIFLSIMYFSGAFKILNDYHNSLTKCKKYLKHRYCEKFSATKDSKYDCSKFRFKKHDSIYFHVYINDNLITDDYLEQLLSSIVNTQLYDNYSLDSCSLVVITQKGGSSLFQEYKNLEEITYQMYADKMQYNCKDINLNYIVDADSENYVQDGVSQTINLLLFLINNNYSFTNITITDIDAYIFCNNQDIIPPISYTKAKEMTETGEYNYLYSMFNNYYNTYIVTENTGDAF